MPSPSSSLATPRLDLGRSFEEFDLLMDQEGFIGYQVLPIFEAARSGGEFGKISIEDLLRTVSGDDDIKRAPGTPYGEDEWTFAPDTFTTYDRGHQSPVDDNDKRNYQDYFDAEFVTTKRVLDVVLRKAEVRVAAAVFNATTWTSYTTSITHEWDDATNAVPITDIKNTKQSVWEQCGFWPNCAIMNRKVATNAKHADSVIDKLKYQGFQDVRPSQISDQALAAALDIPRLIVAGSAKNTAEKGQTASISPIWSDEYIMVCRVAETNDLSEPCIGRTFHWAGDGSMPECIIEQFRDENIRSDKYRARHQVGEKIIYVEAGHLLDNATT